MSDSAAIASLVTQLGYPTAPQQMEARLRKLLSRPEYATLVAESSEEVVGMVGAYFNHGLQFDSSYGRLIGLVVDGRWRGRDRFRR